MFLWLKTLYRKRAVTWPFIFYTIIWTLSTLSHLHSGINFLSPYQRHFGLDKEIMEKRIKTYEEAKIKNPERWSGKIRDWSLPEYVTLNPMSEAEVQEIIISKS